MMSHSGDKQADNIDAFNTASSYLDDILNINNVHTGQFKRTGGCYNELVVAF